MFTDKLDDQSLNPKIHIVEQESKLLQLIL